MALIQCPECKHHVSDMALFCPGCGWPTREELKKLEGEEAERRVRFNPFIRPGKKRTLLGIGLLTLGEFLLDNPALIDNLPLFMGKKIPVDPLWFSAAGAVLLAWGLMKAIYLGCSSCGAVLPGWRTSRCPSCHLAITS